MEERRTAVVILNWNGRGFLERFLPSVLLYSSGVAEVFVIDNASSDDSVEFLRREFPQVRLVENAENGGFSKGYNDGLAQIDAEIIVMLNSDVEVTEHWLDPILAIMDGDPSIAACQPKILCHDDKTKFEYAGGAGGFIDAFGYPFCRGRVFDVLEPDEGQYDDVCDIFWATGACLAVRADLYRSLGGLDEDFFAHMEEIDFCWRLKNAGHRLVACPESVVYHVGGGSLPKSSPRKTYLNFRNNLFLLVKNLPAKRLGWVLFIRFFLDMFASFVFFVKGARGDAFAVWRAQCHFVRSFPKIWKMRLLSSQSNVRHVYKGCIVIDHYLRGVDYFSELKPEKWT